MYSINNNDIELIRGNTACFNVILKDSCGRIIPYEDFEEGDELIFIVKANLYSKPVLEKSIKTGTLYLDAEDTKCIGYGTYFYYIDLKLRGGTVVNVVRGHKFKICKEGF